MDYEKKYNEALERAKKFEEKYGGGYAEYIFTELAESEDEKIKKTIRQLLETAMDAHSNTSLAKPFIDALAWLEKQKEQDWNKKPCLTCQEYENGHKQGYTEGCTAGYNKAMKEVEQKEQKPVEYLDKDKVYAIMTKLTILSYSRLIPINSDEFKKLHEITSDVRDLLNYSIEQKPAEWSEDDEDNLHRVIRVLEDNDSDWKELSDWLKSLRPQYHGDVTMTEAYKMGLEAGKASSWKPSEEQMNALNKACRFIPYNCDILESLYEQLKKL